ncbi:MAG: tRNA 2-selenouridine(34) synthase MnmH [Maledivibacter sp.]|nr:tRNA 2-selenouridine(34) synthase MnmH [Maledivibacter sp.]
MIENAISIEEALNLTNTIFVDVRSEDEFEEAHIPGSINIPILNNEERSEVGKIYRNESHEKAKILGLRYASHKLEGIYSQISKLKKQYHNVIIYCWRGGMRSKSVCTILKTLQAGNIYRLAGGYKSYRKFVLDYFEKHVHEFKFIVLHGLTGVGKTIIIDELEKNNISIMNLEKLAKNSGSVFGDILFEGKSPSQKQFDSFIFNDLYYNDKKYVIVESESKRIGSINVPDQVIKSMVEGYHILIKTSMENRIQNIYNDYVKQDRDINHKLIKCIKHLNKRLGNENVEILIDKINLGDYEYVIEFLIKDYYDPLYRYSIERINNTDLIINYEKIHDATNAIEAFINAKITEGRN